MSSDTTENNRGLNPKHQMNEILYKLICNNFTAAISAAPVNPPNSEPLLLDLLTAGTKCKLVVGLG